MLFSKMSNVIAASY